MLVSLICSESVCVTVELEWFFEFNFFDNSDSLLLWDSDLDLAAVTESDGFLRLLSRFESEFLNLKLSGIRTFIPRLSAP